MKTSKISFCGIVIALCCMIMAFSFISTLSYAVPAIAGVIFIAVVIEYNIKTALLCYVAASLLGLFISPDKFSALLFISFFGYYPIIKAIFEREKNKYVTLLYKHIYFNIIVIGTFFASVYLLKMQDNVLLNYAKGPIGLLALLGLNIVFVMYDIAINNMVMLYLSRIRRFVKK